MSVCVCVCCRTVCVGGLSLSGVQIYLLCINYTVSGHMSMCSLLMVVADLHLVIHSTFLSVSESQVVLGCEEFPRRLPVLTLYLSAHTVLISLYSHC